MAKRMETRFEGQRNPMRNPINTCAGRYNGNVHVKQLVVMLKINHQTFNTQLLFS